MMLVLLLVLSMPVAAWAQQQPGDVYVTAGVVVPHQTGATGESSQTYRTASGGWSRDYSAAIGVALARRVAIEGEWSRTGIMTSSQPSRYDMTFHDWRRDRFLSLVSRFPITSGSSRLEAVAGIVITFAQGSVQTDISPLFGSPSTVQQPTVVHELDPHVGPIVGCDYRLGSRRVAIVPSFRVGRTAVTQGRYDATSPTREIGAIYPGGYPEWTYRGGVGVRVVF